MFAIPSEYIYVLSQLRCGKEFPYPFL